MTAIQHNVECSFYDHYICYRAYGYSLIALRSEDCFVVPLPAVAVSGDELRYALEPNVLIPAESMIVSVHPRRSQTSLRTSIVADGSRLHSAIDELQPNPPLAVTCWATLVCQGLLLQHPAESTEGVLCVVLGRGELVDLLVLTDGTVQQWRYCSAASVVDIVREWQTTDSSVIGVDQTIVAVDVPAESLGSLTGCRITQSSMGAEQLAALAADSILAGKTSVMVDLQGPEIKGVSLLSPVRRYWIALAAAVLLAFLSLTGGMIYRARVYQSAAKVVVSEQELLFAELFPGQKLPVGLLSRFESERRRLRVTRGSAGRPQLKNALEVLHAFLQSVPSSEDGVRFQVQYAKFEGSAMTSLTGAVATLEDLDEFRHHLESGGFQLPAISSRPGPQGVPIQWSQVPWNLPAETSTSDRVDHLPVSAVTNARTGGPQ